MVFARESSHARQNRGGRWIARVAATRSAERPLGWTHAAMTRLPSSTLTWLALGMVALIGLVDHWTGQLALGVFYVLPIAAATWYSGKRSGTGVSVAACVVWLLADMADYGTGILSWNALARFALFFIIVSLVAELREAWMAQQEIAERERATTEELRAANDLKDTLLRTVSHDVRSPLSAIIGSARIIKRHDGGAMTTEQRLALVDGIEESASNLHRMLSDLLDLDRLDRNDVRPNRQPTDLRELVERIVREASCVDRHVVRVDADPLVASVDAAKVERIVANLVQNAAKYSAPGSRVTVRAGVAPGGVELSVADEGPGVPDDLKAEIFEAFRQVDPGSSGAGIGLSLVSKFAALHDGGAWVEDRAEGGANFRVFLSAPVELQVVESPVTETV
jgi:signal transduction histidine kinase